MISTAKIGNNTQIKRNIHSDLNRVHNETQSDNQSFAANLPEDYITGDVFFENVERKLIKRLEDNGYIQ